MTEILADEIEREEEAEELDSTDGTVDTIKSAGEKVIKLFQEDIELLDILENSKVVLRTLLKFTSLLKVH